MVKSCALSAFTKALLRHYGVVPDLFVGSHWWWTPVGAFGGRKDVMEKLAPIGPVYQAGTLSGIHAAAGLKILRYISEMNMGKG